MTMRECGVEVMGVTPEKLDFGGAAPHWIYPGRLFTLLKRRGYNLLHLALPLGSVGLCRATSLRIQQVAWIQSPKLLNFRVNMISRRFPKPCRFPEELESEGFPDLLLVNSTSCSTNLWSPRSCSVSKGSLQSTYQPQALRLPRQLSGHLYVL
jgi:hypothetical protein